MPKRTPEADALTDLIIETFQLNGAMLEAGNRITKPHGLTSARWQVMGAIVAEAGGALTTAQIARRMGLARQGVQRIVNELERSGMIVLKDNIDHKRARLVTLSAGGAKALERVSAEQVTWANALAENVGERRLKQAVKVLRAIRERSEALEARTCHETRHHERRR